MTLIVDILARIARQTSVTPPSSWLAASDVTSLEILDFMSETVSDVQDRLDAVGPMSKTVTIAGTGAGNYALPADMVRLHRTPLAVYERQRTRRACVPITDDGMWQHMTDLGTAGAYRYYRLKGYEGAYTIDFLRPLEAGVQALVGYVSSIWIINGSTEKSAFTDPLDNSILPRRLIEAGTIWRFRRRAGLQYDDMQREYETELAKLSNDTRTIRTVAFGDTPPRAPWDVPLPDYIPPGA